MVKIPVYQVRNLPSAAVGTPQMDRSGQIIAAGVGELLDTGVSILQERQDKADNLEAMATFGKYDLDYEKMKADAKQTFFKKPDEYSQHVIDQGSVLTDEYAKNLSPQQEQKFRSIVTNKTAQDASNLVNWMEKRDQEIILGNIQTSYADLELKAETAQDADSLEQILADLTVVTAESGNFVAETTNNTLSENARKGIVKSSLTSSMMTDAQKTYADLISRKYEGVLTPGEEKVFTSQAKTTMINQAILGQYQSLSSSIVEASGLLDSVLTGDTPPADIARRLEWAKLNADKKDVAGQPVISPELVRYYESAFDMAMGARPLTAADKSNAEQAFATEFTGKWKNFWRDKKKVKPEEFDEILGMYADITDARNQGVIDQERFNDLKFLMDSEVSAKIQNKKIAAPLTEALSRAGKFNFFDNPDTVYRAGYDQIRKHLKERDDLSDAEKERHLETYLVQYTREVNALPEDQKERIKDTKRFALDMLNGTSKRTGLYQRLDVFQHPETLEPIRIGDPIDYQGTKLIFLGPNPKTGKLRFQTPDELPKQLERR